MVKKVEHRFSKNPRAMRVIRKGLIDLQEDEKNLLKELFIFRSLDHPSILKIYEFYEDERCYYIVSE